MSGWDACTSDPHQWMRFIECHPGFAGYLQAVGTVIAVLIPVALYIADTVRRLRETKSRRWTLISIIFNPTFEFAVEVARRKLAFTSIVEMGGLTAANLIHESFVIRVPDRLLEVTEEMHLLPGALSALLPATISEAMGFNRSFEVEAANQHGIRLSVAISMVALADQIEGGVERCCRLLTAQVTAHRSKQR